MRRRLIAAVWITGATVPLLMAAVFVVGCCALPFHQVLHRLVPLCEMAVSAMRGGHDHERDAQTPAREKQEHGTRVQLAEGRTQKIGVSPAAGTLPVLLSVASGTGYRSFISLGATRCDQDVGLHVLVDTFRI